MIPNAGIDALAEKYRTLIELRERREAIERAGGRAFPPEEAKRRRRAFRALARRFPSSLSELELSTTELRRRESIVQRLRMGVASPEETAWAGAMLDLHLGLRLLLAARRWMKRGGEASGFAHWCRGFEERAQCRGLEGPSATTWAQRLGISPEGLFQWILHPPDGRWRPRLERALGLRQCGAGEGAPAGGGC